MSQSSDLEIVRSVAEHGVLSVEQATELLFASKQMARRHLLRMEGEGLILRRSGTLVGKRGRPEALIWLGEEGKRLLKCSFGFAFDASPERTRLVDHLLLINWVRIHLGRLETKFAVSSQFLAATSPSAVDSSGSSILRNMVPPSPRSGDQQSYFIPDGAFTLTARSSQKSLLFFLEVDMGTEALANGKGNDVRQKIADYRKFLGTKGYKRYQSVFQSAFHGFRLLFLCPSLPRRQQLCRLLRELAPTDFVWTAGEHAMHTQGLGGPIFSVGGRDHEPARSILGSLANSSRHDSRTPDIEGRGSIDFPGDCAI